jgi:hypothetical protein
MPETMTAGELLDAYEAYRTQHMQTQPVRGDYDPRFGDDIARDKQGKPLTEDVLVLDAEALVGGAWRKIQQVGTDHNDDSRPVFLDLEAGGRQVLTMDDSVTVRGLTSPDPWAGPSK